ncbi:hypothetical protein A8E95_24585 [Burkholderia cenocepacia]|nr:hypothetical protein A8E96_07060 [Burkholderia cenocepacia]ONW29091.1 hypothetical protein A8E95_24585 [Burkholderia cenocepacia]
MAQGTHRRIVSFHGGPALSGKADWHAEHLKANRPRGWPRRLVRMAEPRCRRFARKPAPIPYNRSFPNPCRRAPRLGRRRLKPSLPDCPRTP